MIAYILIVVSMGVSIDSRMAPREYPIITMQRFGDVGACKHAAYEVQRLAAQRVNTVCVPEKVKP